MEQLTCIIVDDEPLAIRLLEHFIGRTPFLSLLASYADSVEALSALRENPSDLVFLDIQMPDLDGMELSRMVPDDTRIIFTTAFKQYAFDSYEVNALDFLLKPIRYNKFLAAAEKAKQWFGLREKAAAAPTKQPTETATDDALFIKADGELKRVELSRLLFVMGMKDYVVFQLLPDDSHREHAKGETLITHLTMTAVEGLLPAGRFLRVHRSYIVALDKIRSVDKDNCIYIGNEIIHVPEAFREKFQRYLAGKTAG